METIIIGETLRISIPLLILIITVVLLFIYLLLAMIFPEKFI